MRTRSSEQEKNLPGELRRLTLFTVHPTDSGKTIDELLRDNQREPLGKLTGLIQRYTGRLKTVTQRYYRVVNTNYLKVYFDGERNQENAQPPFCLTVSLSGFNDIPTGGNAGFVTISLVDSVDAHWLIELLKANLQGESDDVAA